MTSQSGPPANRKPTHWDDLDPVSRGGQQVDGTYPEIVQALQFQSDGSTTAKTLQSAAFSVNATTSAVVAAVLNKRIKVYAVVVSVDTDGTTVVWKDGSTALNGSEAFAAKGGYALALPPPAFLLATSAGAALNLTTATGTASGFVSYWTDDAT